MKVLLIIFILALCLSSCGQQTTKATVTPLASLSGDYGSIAWLDNWLIIERRDDAGGANYAYSSRLWRVRPDGTGLERISIPNHPGCQQNAFTSPKRLSNGSLSYLIRCLKATGDSEVYMMAYQLENGQPESLLNYAIDSIAIGDYSWNPQITRGIIGGSNILQSHLSWLDRDHLEALDLGFPQALNPQWSPDGKQIAFLAAPDQGLSGTARLDALFNLYLMQPDGTNVRPLVEGFQNATTIAWSLDSRWLVLRATFRSVFAEQGLWLVDIATGQRKLLVSGDFTGVEWSPAGRQLVALQASGTTHDEPRRVVIIDISPFLGPP